MRICWRLFLRWDDDFVNDGLVGKEMKLVMLENVNYIIWDNILSVDLYMYVKIFVKVSWVGVYIVYL